MNLAAYIHLHRTNTPTGVGKHIIHMVNGLAATSGINVTVLAPRDQLDGAGRIPSDNPLASLALTALPFSRRILELSWNSLNWPKIEHWCPQAEWVYCPAESYVPTRKAFLAVTVHDTHYLERDLPWSNEPHHLQGRRRFEKLFRPICRHARLLLAVSEFTKRRLVEILDLNPDRIAVVGNGVEEIYFSELPPAENQDVPVNPYIFVVGGLSQKKGGDYLLPVIRELNIAMPAMRVVISGLGEAPYEEQARAMPNVVRLGYAPLLQQARLMRGAVALLMLSRFEGFGMPAIEAMAAGTPAVVSTFASLPEVVGEAGMVVDADKPSEVVATLISLSQNQALRDRYIGLGRKRAMEFTWGACVRRLVAALKAAE